MHSTPRHTLSSFRLTRVAAALALLSVGGSAQAAISDTVHPYAAVVYSYDDNLLRLPDGVDGPLGRADALTQLQAGLNLERPIGRQLLKADLRVSRVSFNRYSELDYNGKDFSGEWQWAVLRDFTGHLGGSYTETLTSFADFHTSERNLRISRRTYADANWRFLPSWQVNTSFSRFKYDYDLPSQSINNRVEDAANVGIDYLASSGSRVGLVARRYTGEYVNAQRLGPFAQENDYRQKELKANVYWLLSGVTQIQVLAGWARREHSLSGARDSSGADGRVTGFYAPTGKLRFTVSGWREFAAVESALVTSSLNRGTSVAATWAATAKLSADAQLRRETRNFDKVTTLVLPGDASDLSRRASVGLTYAPKPAIQFNLSTYRETRTGSAYVGTGSYTSKGAQLSASGQF